VEKDISGTTKTILEVDALKLRYLINIRGALSWQKTTRQRSTPQISIGSQYPLLFKTNQDEAHSVSEATTK